jgi:hypothetical protein
MEGTIATDDVDDFSFVVDAPKTVSITVHSDSDFAGWLFVIDASGGWLGYHKCNAGQSATQKYFLDEAREWRIELALNVNSNPGDYSIVIEDAQTLPLQSFGETAPVDAPWDDLTLTVDTQELSYPVANGTPTAIRFWVTGVGEVGTVPYSENASLTWSPDGVPGGLYGYSAQLLSDTHPVSDFTPIEYFDLCSDDNAVDIGVLGTAVTVQNNACLKVQEEYPSWWDTRNMQLQIQSGSAYPLPFQWKSSCAGSNGDDTFTNDWDTKAFGPTDDDCATFIKLGGDGESTVSLAYYG